MANQSAGGAPPRQAPPGARGIRSSPLRTRLVVVLVLAALIPLAATTIGGIAIARASLLNQGQQVLRHRATATASTIDNYLEGLKSSLVSSSQELGRLYAADPSLSPSTRTAIQNVLHTDSLANDFTASDATELIGTNRVVLVSDQSGEVGEDLSASPSVHAALNGVTYTLSAVTFDPDGSADLLETVEATVPVHAGDGGPLIGVLRARFSMGRFAGLVANDASPSGGGLLVESTTGLVLAQSLQPNAKLLFATVLPANKALIASINPPSRLADSVDSRTVAAHPIPGLTAAQLRSSGTFSAGMIDGTDASEMLYVPATVDDSPAGAPWVYLLGTSRAALTAPADQFLSFGGATTASLAQVAAILSVIALLASLLTGLLMARWIGRWLSGTIRGLGETARAFLALSNDQRQTAEEQRQRLTTARGGLHELHRTAGELAESIERAISAAEHIQQSRAYHAGQHMSADTVQVPGIGHWSQWSAGVRDRLIRQHTICTGLAQDARSTGDAAVHMRERGMVINTQAIGLEASLRASRSITSRDGAPRRPGGASGLASFGTSTLRLGLVGILLLLGALPSLLLATTTTTLLRGNLSQQSTGALMAQAQSSQRAVDELLRQQAQQVSGLETLYRSLQDPTSGITTDLANSNLASSVVSAKEALGTSLLEVADAANGTIVASSSRATLNHSLAGLPVYQAAAGGHAQAATSLVYDQPGQPGWYFIAAPLRSTDLTHIIGVAVGQFSVQPLQDVLRASDAGSDSSSTYALVIERSDGILLADSRASGNVFAATGPLGSGDLQTLWSQGRYPNGVTPNQTPLPEVSSQSRSSAPSGSSSGIGFTGASGDASSPNAYWLIPLNNAPWALLEAQPLSDANSVADRLTRYDLLLAAIVTLLATILAVILGQSIVVPVQRLRGRYRDAARRLVAATRRQEEAAQRQEAVLPPIESTAQLLTLETEEVGSLLFPEPASRGTARPAPPAPPSAFPGSQGAWPDIPPQRAPATPQHAGAFEPPPLEALRRARVLANDWGLRQQRVLADLATALNATDQLSRASLEGQQEASALTTLAVELLNSSR